MAFAPALFIAGTAIKAGSGIMQANAAYKAGRAQKRQAMTEADMVEQATLQSERESAEQIRRARVEQRAATGTMRAAIAGSGVVQSQGSPIEILGRAAALQELQIQDYARRSRAESASGFARAKQIRIAGKSALAAGKAASYGQLANTAASTAFGIYKGYDSGLLKFGSNKSLMPATA